MNSVDPHTAAPAKCRWHQFSLRTLLIAIAIFACVLAVTLQWIAPSQRQRAAVKAVIALGGRVQYEPLPPDEVWYVTALRDWLPQDYFELVQSVDLGGTKTTDADLAKIKILTNLRSLDLEGDTQVTDAGLATIAQFASLESLNLQGNAHVTDAGLRHLTKLKNLWRFGLPDHVTSAAAEQLSTELIDCKVSFHAFK